MAQPTALNVGNLLQLQARHVHLISAAAILDNKVIGYYESWSARKECYKVAPTDLLLDALTHDHGQETPASLFKDTANIKSIKEDISIDISVGGWTFSDNGTATQPLYGEIAADASKRKKFTKNIVHFLKQYEDTANFVLLMKTLRNTFDASGNKFGLTFTAPSSYWYLQWFDLPGILKYADWINLMNYNLHGACDADNTIGSIIPVHTNLTKSNSLQSCFGVQRSHRRLVMGFGFYGRLFTLADKSRTKPGCPFKGASDPGPCSKTGGILGYYKIMEILKLSLKRSILSPVHDKSDAVNYLTFDDDQWISYDDKTTFTQNIDWAASVGLGGALVWASDLAIDKALSNQKSVVEGLSSFNGQKYFKYEGHCVKLDDNDAMADACGSGYTVIGWDDAGCGKKSCHCRKPICCPTNSAPKNCNWRGDNTGDSGMGSDCSAIGL
ncbi:glycoside hydrolase superfamily [Aspergillus navahoensis]